ncbi:hypothetical protein N431DRAFT_69344 [Stipitochalara longipes BDJ]|nr:hypothetical protein N431DRAFT_69344 [Stipitochalara longipes BDJ]
MLTSSPSSRLQPLHQNCRPDCSSTKKRGKIHKRECSRNSNISITASLYLTLTSQQPPSQPISLPISIKTVLQNLSSRKESAKLQKRGSSLLDNSTASQSPRNPTITNHLPSPHA